MKFDPLVAQIIVATDFDNFTTGDVRSAYLAIKNNSSLVPTVVRRRIYAELLKLVKKGWLKKLVSSKKGFTRFNKTKSFNVEVIIKLAHSIPIATAKKAAEKQALLLIKLDHYRAELLLNIGESEAYKELYVDSPEFADELQPQYDNAKDNNTRILGKIRAIEGLLKQHEVLKQM